MTKRVNILVVAAAVLSFCASAEAGMYVCKSPGGSVSFTNAPTSSNCSPYQDSSGDYLTGGVSESTYTPSSTARTYSSSTSLSYDSYIQGAGYRYSVDPDLIKAIIRVESDFNRYAVSRVGAQGLMQLMPDTAKEMNVSDPFDPMENIYGGTLYMHNLLKMFKGDVRLALAAYNAGPTAVKKANDIPRYPETIRYVKKVLAHYKRYKGLYSNSSNSSLRLNDLKIASTR